MGEILLFLRKRNVHWWRLWKQKVQIRRECARTRGNVTSIFFVVSSTRGINTQVLFLSVCDAHYGQKKPILQHQDDRIKTTQRKKRTFLRFFLSFGLLLPISYRGMVATLCYPTLPSQVFLRGRRKVAKVSGHPPICVNHLSPNRSLERYKATCNWTDNFLSSSIFLLHLVSRSRRSPLRHRQTRNKLLNHQIKSVQDLTTNLD